LEIENYFKILQDAVDSCPVARLKNISYDKRGTYEGFIRGELYFSDGSVLYFREFTDTGGMEPERLMYTYHYADSEDGLIFRYDNTGHHRKLGLLTWPHHKHESSETNVISSDAPKLAMVLQEIESMCRTI